MLYIFFFLMLLIPTAYQPFRGVLLLFLLFKYFTTGKRYVNKTIQKYWNLNFVVCLFAFFIGLLNGNPGVLNVITISLIWPVLYLMLMRKVHSLNIIGNLFKVIVYGGLITGFLNAILLINEAFFGIGLFTKIAELLGYRYGIFDGYTEFFSPTQSYFPYFLFFYISLLVIPLNSLKIDKKHIGIGAFLMLTLILFSGRRAMWVVVVLLPLILFLTLHYTKLVKFGLFAKIIPVVCIIIFVISYLLIHYLNLEEFFRQAETIFDFYEDDSNYERNLQFQSLFKDFCENPLFGNGLGHVSRYIRTPDAPWQYELSYNYDLTVYGLFGSIVQYITYGIVIAKSFRIVRFSKECAEYVIPPIVGFFAIAIINATNPYLEKFDFLWTFFLPIIVLNTILCSKNNVK